MADPKYLPPQPSPAEVPGGRIRGDLLVELPGPVRHRVDLETRLHAGDCGFSAPDHPAWTAADLDLLIEITAERFDPGLTVTRHRALDALGDLLSRNEIEERTVVDRLTALATAIVEPDSIRVAALAALPPDHGDRMAELLAQDISPLVREWAAARRGDRYERRAVPGATERDPERGPAGSE